MEAKPLIVIIGPTASGKTTLAVELAEKFNGEIVCADSRTVYRGMDIGTAKPTPEEQQRVPHWGLDLVDPDKTYTAADFKTYANQKIEEIRSRGKVPFLVGGSGLYIDAVVFDYQFGRGSDPSARAELEKMTVEQLQRYCHENNIRLPENHKNRRYLIRTIERGGNTLQRRSKPLDNSLIVGIMTDRNTLHSRIETRAEFMFRGGAIIQEAKALAVRYDWSHESMTGNIYPVCKRFLNGELSLDEAMRKFVIQDRRLAKKQMTWFKRNPFITWLSLDGAQARITSLLDSEH